MGNLQEANETEWEVVEETLRVTLGPMMATIVRRGPKTWEWVVAPTNSAGAPPWTPSVAQLNQAAAVMNASKARAGIPSTQTPSPYTGFSAAGGNCSTRERAKEAALGIIAAATYIYERETST